MGINSKPETQKQPFRLDPGFKAFYRVHGLGWALRLDFGVRLIEKNSGPDCEGTRFSMCYRGCYNLFLRIRTERVPKPFNKCAISAHLGGYAADSRGLLVPKHRTD